MDAMKMLEASTESSKREMEILDALQDIRCVSFPLRSIFARCFCRTSFLTPLPLWSLLFLTGLEMLEWNEQEGL